MRAWRLSQPQWALDKSNLGAKKFGGRWNPVNMGAMYAGTTVEICALEKFVHIAASPPPDLLLVAIDLPDDGALWETFSVDDLPVDWDSLPMSASAAAFGGEWLSSSDKLYMRVPSVIVPEASNLVVNPAHPAYANEVRMAIKRYFTYDSRMWKPAPH